MNSSHNVSKASLRVMQREFIRGMNIVGLNIDKKSTDWADLFEPTNFFDKFPIFIEVLLNEFPLADSCFARHTSNPVN